MAPERFDGWSDPRSDVYALGATLYELLTLRPAFDESDRVKLIEHVLHESPTPLRQLDRRIPRDLETIVLKAMAKEPGERYATAGQLAEDLRRFVAGKPILARRIGSIERSWRWSRRNPLVAGAAGTVAAALVADRGRRPDTPTGSITSQRASEGEPGNHSADCRSRQGTRESEDIAGRIESSAGDPQLRSRPGRLREGTDRRRASSG